MNKNLPPERQFLITKGVPCSKRIKDIKESMAEEREVEDGWISTDNPDSKRKDKDGNVE
jgi:hypothetical protein